MSFVTITNVNAVTNVNIRPYRARDQTAVVDLWEKCGLVVPHNDPLRDIESKQQVNPEWFLVGELVGQVVATCMVGYEGHRGWINYLAVSPDYSAAALPPRWCCGRKRFFQTSAARRSTSRSEN